MTSILRTARCTACNKNIQSTNTRSIICSVCHKLRHLKCTPFMNRDVDAICPQCIDELFPFCNIVDDVNYHAAISGRREDATIDFSLLSKIKLELGHSLIPDVLHSDDDLDADIHYYNNLFNTPSEYYESCTLEKIIPKPCYDDVHSLMHINVRSLHKNIGRVVSELSVLPNKPSIIALTETWAHSDDDAFHIPGYSNVMKARKNRVGGGVGLLLHDHINIEYKLRPDLSLDDPFESLFIQLTNPRHKNPIIGVVYKPPNSNIVPFIKTVEQKISMISKEHRPCYLLGDYNINLLNYDKHLPTQDFLNTLLSYGFYPLINKPTRVTEYNTTLIDNIFTNTHYSDVQSGIWTVDISDHLPVFTVLPSNSKKSKTKKVIRKQDFTEENINKFKHDLNSQNWADLNQYSDIDQMYNAFINTVQTLYEQAFPLKTKTVSVAINHLPWITPAIKKSINKKNSLYKTFIKKRSTDSKNKYKSYRNKLTAILRKAERQYYLTKLERVKDNLGKTWRILNSITSRNTNSERIREIIHNGKKINDDTVIANIFNNYFANIGPNLAKTIPQASDNFTHFLPSNNSNSIFLRPTDSNEICDIIGHLKNSYSKGPDKLSTITLKNCRDELCEPLCLIFNKSIQDGVVPSALKVAKVVPIYKTDDKKLVSNYRPISVLPVFSKILERLIYARVIDFLNKHDILSTNQYGFRKNLSTSMALLDLVDKLANSIENNEITIGIFVDLAKAFDTVNHKILLAKLDHYGVRGIALDWFQSYLSNRNQFVCINDTQSDPLPVVCGVPQGSILGPLLFLLYINDLNYVSKILTLIMFADDTNIFISGKNLNEITSSANIELEKINDWFCANLLSLNIKKTNYIMFGYKNLPNIDILINSQKIMRVYQTKFLGVIIQHNLKWHAHVQLVKNKISKTIGIMNKVKSVLSTSHLTLLYQTLIEPYLTYGCIIWASPEKIHFLRFCTNFKNVLAE